MKNVAIIVAVIAIIVCVVVLLKGCKSEKTGGADKAFNITSETEFTTTTTRVTTTEKFLEYVEVTVMGSEYIFNNRKSSIESIIASADAETIIKITDSNAAYDAMSALLSALSENNISYVIQK